MKFKQTTSVMVPLSPGFKFEKNDLAVAHYTVSVWAESNQMRRYNYQISGIICCKVF